MKAQINFRASKLTVEQMEALIEQTGMTQTELVSTAIDRMYQQEIGTMIVPNVNVRKGEDVYQAAKRAFGEGVVVVTNATPDKHKGEEPIGKVTVRRGESYPVYRRS